MKSAAATLTGKKKALIKKEAAEYQQAFDNEQRAKRDLEQASMELSSLAQKETSLLQQMDHQKSIRRQLDSLVHEVRKKEGTGTRKCEKAPTSFLFSSLH